MENETAIERILAAQEQIRHELRDINFRLDHLLDIFRDEFGPVKPHP